MVQIVQIHLVQINYLIIFLFYAERVDKTQKVTFSLFIFKE